jgi:hypothetical protein
MTQNEIRTLTSSVARDRSLATGSGSGVPSRLGRTTIEYGRMPALTLPRNLMSESGRQAYGDPCRRTHGPLSELPSAGRGVASWSNKLTTTALSAPCVLGMTLRPHQDVKNSHADNRSPTAQERRLRPHRSTRRPRPIPSGHTRPKHRSARTRKATALSDCWHAVTATSACHAALGATHGLRVVRRFVAYAPPDIKGN